MSPLHAHKVDAAVRVDGTVQIEGVPFPPGTQRSTPEEIERSRQIRETLRGSVYRYDDPFEPAVPLEDWNALNPVSESDPL